MKALTNRGRAIAARMTAESVAAWRAAKRTEDLGSAAALMRLSLAYRTAGQRLADAK